MKTKISNITNSFLLLIIVSILSSATIKGQNENAQDEFPRGEIIPNVICKDKPDQSYVLYLPKNYSREKQWPIIFAFDPGARGKIPVELFQTAAEKYGYIVVCSNNSKNGPISLADQAIFAMWKDTRQRFTIDSRRIYATGFSGGARAAGRFHKLTGKSCAGIIACGAGLPENFGDLGELYPAAWYGIIGLRDFNYYELLDMDAALDKRKITHHVEILDMEHRWPPVDDIERAISWMEINALKNNTRTKDDAGNALIHSIYQEALTRANNLELAGNIPFAVNAYDWAAKLFNGLSDISIVENKKAQLMASKVYKSFEQDEKERRQKVINYFKNFSRVVYYIEHPFTRRLSAEDILKELQLEKLRKEAGNKKNVYESSLAFRVLSGFRNDAYDKGSEFYRKADYEKAILFFEICSNVEERTYFSAYNLACAYALNKQKKPALKALELACKRGLNDPSLLDNDKDLDFIRNEKAFQEIKQKINFQDKKE